MNRQNNIQQRQPVNKQKYRMNRTALLHWNREH